MKNRPSSVQEEALCVLYTIAGLLALSNGLKIFAFILFAKAFTDLICSIVAAILERKCEALQERLEANKEESGEDRA